MKSKLLERRLHGWVLLPPRSISCSSPSHHGTELTFTRSFASALRHTTFLCLEFPPEPLYLAKSYSFLAPKSLPPGSFLIPHAYPSAPTRPTVYLVLLPSETLTPCTDGFVQPTVPTKVGSSKDHVCLGLLGSPNPKTILGIWYALKIMVKGMLMK